MRVKLIQRTYQIMLLCDGTVMVKMVKNLSLFIYDLFFRFLHELTYYIMLFDGQIAWLPDNLHVLDSDFYCGVSTLL